MKLYELKHEEEFLIRAMRAFSFLELYGYTITGYKYNIFDFLINAICWNPVL